MTNFPPTPEMQFSLNPPQPLLLDSFVVFWNFFMQILENTDRDSSLTSCIHKCQPAIHTALHFSLDTVSGCLSVSEHRDIPPPFTFYNSIVFRCCCSVAKSRLTLCDPMDCSMPGFPVLHYFPEFVGTSVHSVGDDVQPSHPVLPSSPLTLNLSQHQRLFQFVSSSHQVARVLELQLQHQSFK